MNYDDLYVVLRDRAFALSEEGMALEEVNRLKKMLVAAEAILDNKSAALVRADKLVEAVLAGKDIAIRKVK